MTKVLAALTFLLVSMTVHSAGFGFDPFDRNSPTSSNGASKPTPASPQRAVPPAKNPVPASVPPIKQDTQTPKSPSSQNKK